MIERKISQIDLKEHIKNNICSNCNIKIQDNLLCEIGHINIPNKSEYKLFKHSIFDFEIICNVTVK